VLSFVALWLWPQPKVQRLVYPWPYRDLVCQEARDNQLPPSLVAAVILHESEFRPNATSPVGALGLMQLMPDTGRWVHEHLESGSGIPDLKDPSVNVHLGVSYLSYLGRRFQGNWVAALAAYNAGPEFVRDWDSRSAFAGLKVKEIPFPETRAYVEAVLRSERMYCQLYPEIAYEGIHP